MRPELVDLLDKGVREDWVTCAAERWSRVQRFLVGRLYGDARGRAVRALGWVASDANIATEARLTELMRRFVWALNDESGAVPFGIPEAMGELMACRPELIATYLPILCSMLTADEMSQTGDIERGVMRALARVGKATATICPEAIAALRVAASTHADAETRRTAESTLEQLT